MVNLDASDNLGIRWNWYFIALIKLTGRKRMEIKLNAISHFVNMYASYFPFLQTSQTINQPTKSENTERLIH